MEMKMISINTSIHLPQITFPSSRRRCTVVKASSNSKVANLSASRKERIELPDFDGCHISEFLKHPSGIKTMLNTTVLESFQFVEHNTYRCTLPKLKLLNFEAAPVIDLRVTPTDEHCLVELLSCKFEGSDIMERQNKHFSAFMSNYMTWNTNESGSYYLEADVNLRLALEIYTKPFTLLPTSAVEGPGNKMMQALVDRLVPLLLQQLLQDYEEWVHQKAEALPDHGQINSCTSSSL